MMSLWDALRMNMMISYQELVRTFPSRRAHDKSDRFHFWDYESDKKNHVLSLQPEAIKSLVVTDQNFHPQEFVNWTPNWFIARDWGQYS